MRRPIRESMEQKMMEVWWVRIGLFALFLILAFVMFSLAIDSGNALEYLLGFVFLVWAVDHLVRTVKSLRNR